MDELVSSAPPEAVGVRWRRGRIAWVAAAVALCAVLAGGILWWRLSIQVRYITAPVTRGDIVRSINMTGALNPVVTAQVGSYVSGNIKAWYCDYNKMVKKDEVCALIDPLPFQVVVDQDEADLRTTRAQLVKDKAARDNAKLVYDRDKGLREEGIVSQETLDGDKATFDQDVAQVALDEASIADKEAVLHGAQVNLGYTKIKSPVDGMVITRYIDVGQTVVSNLQASTMFLIGKDMRSMQVDTNVSEADVGDVHEGERSFFTVQAYPSRTFEGKVRQIREGPITVQNVVTYDVVVDVPNEDLALYPGMTADTHIVTAERRNVLRVPLPATRFVPEGMARGGSAAGGAPRGSGPRSGAPPGTPSAGGPSAIGESTGSAAPGGPGPGAREAFRARFRAGAGAEDSGGSRPDRPPGARQGGGGRRASAAGRLGVARLWVMRDGKLTPVNVRTGLDDGTLIEVIATELKPGDQVVVNAVRPEGARPQAGGNARPPGTAPGRGGGGGFRL